MAPPGFVLRRTFLEFAPEASDDGSEPREPECGNRRRSRSEGDMQLVSEELEKFVSTEKAKERCVERFLPKALVGTTVLESDDGCTWKVLDTIDQFTDCHLWYRRSMSMTDTAFLLGSVVSGMVVQGIDEGGWIRVPATKGSSDSGSAQTGDSCSVHTADDSIHTDDEASIQLVATTEEGSSLPPPPGCLLAFNYVDKATPSSEPEEKKQSDRTTLQFDELPTYYDRELLVETLNSGGFTGCFNFVFVPKDLRTGTVFGHALINFLSHDLATRALSHFDGWKDWKVESTAVCRASWSKYCQGLHALIERHRNSPVMHDKVSEVCKPMVLEGGVPMAFPPPTRRVRMPRERGKQNGQETIADEEQPAASLHPKEIAPAPVSTKPAPQPKRSPKSSKPDKDMNKKANSRLKKNATAFFPGAEWSRGYQSTFVPLKSSSKGDRQHTAPGPGGAMCYMEQSPCNFVYMMPTAESFAMPCMQATHCQL